MNADSTTDENEALRELLYLAPIGLMQFDLNGRIKLLNPMMIQLLMAGSPMADLTNAFEALREFPADLRARIREFGTTVGQIVGDERYGIIAGERPKVLSLNLFRHDDDVYVASLSDVTTLVEQESALGESREYLRLALRAGRIVTFRQDLRRDRIDFELAGEADFAGDALRKALTEHEWLAVIHQDDRDRIRLATAKALEGRSPELNYEYRLVDPETEAVLHIDSRSRIFYGAAGEPLSAIGVAIDVSEKRLSEANLRHLAYHDPLTGLSNRALFRQRLEEALVAMGQGKPFALFCLDLDQFKTINDTFGHPVGDQILKEAGRRLSAMAREADSVARLGGDEFALILTDVRRTQDCEALATRIVAGLSAPYGLGEKVLSIGVSVGVAMSGQQPLDARTLLRQADLALYRAKSEGRGRACFYDLDVDEALHDRRTLSLRMPAALANGEFELFYQPMMDVGRRELIGLEALIRWRHPDQGVLAPTLFIPLAEANGFIVTLGAWVLEQACREAATWDGDLKVAVNLSPVQILDDHVVSHIARALAESKLPASRLEVELTEAIELAGTPRNINVLKDIRDLGVSLVLDDFGTGHSSLNHLRLFPFTKVKIDRALVANIDVSDTVEKIVSAAVRLCRELGLRTLAEGIETEDQLKALGRIGCDEAQGHLFSPPAEAKGLAALAKRLAVV